METEIGQGTSSCVKDGLFSDNARHNEDELIPADAGSHIGIAELFLQDGTHPPEDNIPGAVAERIVDAPEIVDVHDAEEKGPILQPKPASAF